MKLGEFSESVSAGDAAVAEDAGGRVIVAIASAGRGPILADTVAALRLQTRLPDLLLLSLGDPADGAAITAADLPFAVRVLTGPKGLTIQRNAILGALMPGDLVLMLDDDFLMAPDYLAQMAALFARNPEIVLTTGTVLHDGIRGPGYDHPEGRSRLAAALEATPVPGDGMLDVKSGYGCNMALRADPILRHGLRFDETLPAYGWLEDVDFSTQIGRHGRIVRAEALRGVHLGTKTGRSRGVPLGYSQIANPLYLVRKGTIGRKRALRLMMRNFGSNILHSIRPEPWTDHKGRLRGNLIAFRDVLARRDSPQAIVRLQG